LIAKIISRFVNAKYDRQRHHTADVLEDKLSRVRLISKVRGLSARLGADPLHNPVVWKWIDGPLKAPD
jgi:hypothetical protein